MSWDTEKHRVKRSRLATLAMIALASLATAVGARGLHEFAVAMNDDRDETPSVAPTLIPVTHGQMPASPLTIEASASTVMTTVAPVVSTSTLTPPAVTLASIGRPQARTIASAGTPVLPSSLTAPVTYVAPVGAPAFTLATPVETGRGMASGVVETFAASDRASSDDSRRPVATNGRTVEIVDAGPLSDLGPIVDAGSPRPIFRPPSRGPLVGAGVPVDALDPDPSAPDAAGGGPVDAPIELPYEVIVDSGNADIGPVDGPLGGPVDLEKLGYVLLPNGEMLLDANGVPVMAPEPTTLLALAGLALAGRRRRRA
jgi:hypothetical protein